MRPFEILVLIAVVVSFARLAIPYAGLSRMRRYLAAAGPIAAIAQLAIEGARWQMVPLYALAVLFFLVSALSWSGSSAERVEKSIARRIAAWLLTGLGLIALAIAAALPILIPVFRFPPPTGRYEIGALTYHLVDQRRPEIFSSDPTRRRELMVQIWYPARDSRNLPRAPYIQPGSSFPDLAALLHLPSFFFTHLRYVTTNAAQAAPIATDRPDFPVILFSPGRGGFRQHNTLQVEELVSHGYIVAAIDHPYAGSEVIFPDGHRAMFDRRMLDRGFVDSVTHYLGEDDVAVLNWLGALDKADPRHILTGRLDVRHAGIFGASLGGMDAAEACRLDSSFKACLILDVRMPADVVKNGLRQPVMWISRGADTMRLEGWPAKEIGDHQTTMRSVFDGLPGDGYLVLVRGMFHANIADFPLLMSEPAARALGAIGPVDARKAHDVINSYSLAFFDRHLKGEQIPLLRRPSALPDVTFESRR